MPVVTFNFQILRNKMRVKSFKTLISRHPYMYNIFFLGACKGVPDLSSSSGSARDFGIETKNDTVLQGVKSLIYYVEVM